VCVWGGLPYAVPGAQVISRDWSVEVHSLQFVVWRTPILTVMLLLRWCVTKIDSQ
jgi:hypothetical protein